MRKTKCKVLSTILTLVFLLANVPVLAQGTDAPELTISYVKFTDGAGTALNAIPAEGTEIRAAIGVRKSGAAAAEASLYLAQYSQDGKLTAIDTTVQNMNLAQDERILVAKGKTAAGTKTLKALLWNGDDQSPMVCAGSFPTAGGIEAIYIDGVQYEDFNENVFSYFYRLSGKTLPKVTVKTTDNAAKAEVSYVTGADSSAEIKVNGQTYTIYFESGAVTPRISNIRLLTDKVSSVPTVTEFKVGAEVYSDPENKSEKVIATRPESLNKDTKDWQLDAFNNCYLLQPPSDWERNSAWMSQEEIAWYSFDINQTAEIYVLSPWRAPNGMFTNASAYPAINYETEDKDGNIKLTTCRGYRLDVPVSAGETRTVTMNNLGSAERYLVLVKFKDIYDIEYNGGYSMGQNENMIEWHKRMMSDTNLKTGDLAMWDRMALEWGYYRFGYIDPLFEGATYIRTANGPKSMDYLDYPMDAAKEENGISFKVTSDVDVYLLYKEWIKPVCVTTPNSPWEYSTNGNGYVQVLNADGGSLFWFKAMAHQRFSLPEGHTDMLIKLPNTGYMAVIKKADVITPIATNLKYHGPEPDAYTDEEGKPVPGYKNAANFVKGIHAGDQAYQDRNNIIIKQLTDQLGFENAYYLQTQLDNKNTGNPEVYTYYAEPDKTWFTFDINASADIIMLNVGGYVPPAIANDDSWIKQASPARDENNRCYQYYADIQTTTSVFQQPYDTMSIKSVDVVPGETQTVTIPTMGRRCEIPIILVRFK